MSGKFISPYTDYGFKKLFGTEENKDLLISLLNSLISDKADPITDLTYKNVEQIGRAIKQRASYFDVYCETQSGSKFIVEMQSGKQDYFKDRSLFYAAKPIRDQGVIGDQWDFRLEEVYMIALMDFTFPAKEYPDDNYYHEVKLMDVTDKHVFYDKLTLIYLEMKKLKKVKLNLDNMRERWMHAFYHLCYTDQYPEELHEDVFKKLFRQAEIANLNQDQLFAYERSLMDIWDYYSVMKTSHREGREEGLEEGREEGREQGRKEGRKEGREEGREEGRKEGFEKGEQSKALDIAQKMKALGLDPETIYNATGVRSEE